MATREQLTDERVRELITELGNSGIIPEAEAKGLTSTQDFREAADVRESTGKPATLSRSNIGQPTKDEFETAYLDGDIQAQIAVIWEIVTGEEVA